MSIRQRVKREIFLRAENFVSDLQRPIYNKNFEFPSFRKKSPDEIPTPFSSTWTEKHVNLILTWEADRIKEIYSLENLKTLRGQ